MQRTCSVSVLLLLAIAGMCRAGNYSSEALWRNDIGTYSLETFEGFSVGTTLVNDPTLNVRFDQGELPTVYSAGSAGGNPRSGVNVLGNSTPNLAIQIRAAPGYYIVGVGVWNSSGDDFLQMFFFDDRNRQIGWNTTGGFSDLRFIGIISSQPVTEADLFSNGGGDGRILIDDLQVRTALIPAPASVVVALMYIAPRRNRR